jgi:hypothetical protein
MNITTESNLTAEGTSEAASRQEQIEAIVRSLRILLEGDEKEQRETFAYLKQVLDEDRFSTRRLFP